MRVPTAASAVGRSRKQCKRQYRDRSHAAGDDCCLVYQLFRQHAVKFLAGGSEGLLKCDFGETSKLARMQALRFLEFEGLERFQTDLKMLADPLPIEVACHAG